MGQFNINITANGSHGCARREKPGDKLYSRCNRMDCVDCRAYDFAQLLRQQGNTILSATFTQWPGTEDEVVDDLVNNVRKSGNM